MRALTEWRLTAGRVAIHLATGTAVAADLHLGYDRVRRRGGEAVPARTVAEELAPLTALLRAEDTRRLVIAGDLFEDGRVDRDELVEELIGWLERERVELVAVVPGNHDRGLGSDERLPISAGETRLGRWHVVHGDAERPAGAVVQGHEHPWFRWRTGTEGPCYLVSDDHLVLPAYSRDAAGGNVVGARRWAAYRCCAIAAGRVLDFGELGRLTSYSPLAAGERGRG
jgi:metallophosphoesterase superfamily enzyme